MKFLALLAIAGACSAQAVTIINSGSTNRPGFQIVVEKSGKAVYTSRARSVPMEQPAKRIEKNVGKPLAKKLYADTRAARPLASLPAPHCAKSASFGSRTYLVSGSEESPDLTCGDGGDPKLRALIGDATEIIRLMEPRP